MTRVCHLSSAHKGLDVRIFFKQCVTLASAGYDTHLVIAASYNDCRSAFIKNVFLHPLPVPSGRFSRLFLQGWRCFYVSCRLNADIYHFHDLELAPYGVLLSLIGKKVIYDVHEDVPQDILTKDWIAPHFRRTTSFIIGWLEYICSKFFFHIVAATPFIANRFRPFALKTVDINNFPILSELTSSNSWAEKNHEVCYVGGIGRIRGIVEVVQAMGQLRSSTGRLNLAGQFSDMSLQKRLESHTGWQRVNSLGFVDRAGVRDVLVRSMAGLVTLHPIINYIDALPVKMFEYMSAGIPVIASDFPLWREIIAGNDCGLMVDPLNPKSIAEAIDYMITHPKDAERMGRNGRRAVENQYNWAHEGKKLLAFYEAILKPSASTSSFRLR